MNHESEVACKGDDWLIATWQDGTWCNMSEEDTLATLTDVVGSDYIVERVLTYDANGYVPLKTEPV